MMRSRRLRQAILLLIQLPLVCLIIRFCYHQARLAALPNYGAPAIPFTVIRQYPHDPRAFTEGLLFADGFLYESTGLNGRSSLRKVDVNAPSTKPKRL